MAVSFCERCKSEVNVQRHYGTRGFVGSPERRPLLSSPSPPGFAHQPHQPLHSWPLSIPGILPGRLVVHAVLAIIPTRRFRWLPDRGHKWSASPANGRRSTGGGIDTWHVTSSPNPLWTMGGGQWEQVIISETHTASRMENSVPSLCRVSTWDKE